MNIPLSLKKRILSITVMFIVLGNVIRVFSPQTISGVPNITDPIPTYAATRYDTDFNYLPEYDFAYEQTNYQSIQEKYKNIYVDQEKVRKIRAYMSRRGAPLAAEAETFVKIADEYNLPYNLMPAISIIESSGGMHNYRPYNYAGMGGQSNAYVFANYQQAIETHARIIRKGYFDKGATTPEAMEKYYCLNCPTWGEKVQGVMNSIDNS